MESGALPGGQPASDEQAAPGHRRHAVQDLAGRAAERAEPQVAALHPLPEAQRAEAAQDVRRGHRRAPGTTNL